MRQELSKQREGFEKQEKQLKSTINRLGSELQQMRASLMQQSSYQSDLNKIDNNNAENYSYVANKQRKSGSITLSKGQQ